MLRVGCGGLLRVTVSLEMSGETALVAKELVTSGTDRIAFVIVIITGSLSSKMTGQDR